MSECPICGLENCELDPFKFSLPSKIDKEFKEDFVKRVEGRKNDQNKLRMDLIPPEALEELAKVLTYGASKYADRNWENGIKWGRVLGATLRHIIAWMKGEIHDPETGLSHLSHALCNLVFLVTYEQRKMKGFDDVHRKTENME